MRHCIGCPSGVHLAFILVFILGCNSYNEDINDLPIPPEEKEDSVTNQYLKGLSITLDSLEQIGLPVIVINTVGNEEPTCEFVLPPEGCMGSSINNATKVPCSVIIQNGGGHFV